MMAGWWKDEEGQATTEYILILALVVAMLMMVVSKLLRPVFAKMREMLGRQIDQVLFPSGEGLHRFRRRR